MEEGDLLKNETEIEFIPEIELEDEYAKWNFGKKSHKQAIKILRKLYSSISCLISGGYDDNESRGKSVLEGISNYLKLTSTNRKKLGHMQIFQEYEMPGNLMHLYNSPVKNNKEIAEEAIRLFLYPNIQSFPIPIRHRFASIVLEICNLLRRYKTTTSDNLLYYSCRQTYESLLKSMGPKNCGRFFFYAEPHTLIRDCYPFMEELAKQLIVNMKLIRESCFCRVPSGLKLRFQSDVDEFSLLALHMCTNINEHMRTESLDSLPVVALDEDESYYVMELRPFYDDFNDLLNNIDLGLTYMDDGVEYKRCTQCEFNNGWSYYILILKELDMIAKLYHPAERDLFSCLNSHRDSINKLVMRTKRGDNHQWLLRHKSLLNNESRRHLITMAFPNEVKNGCDHPQKMTVLIDRSQLLFDSFEHVGLANPILLRNGIIPQFKNEIAIAGPGALREWLLLVCKHLFAPQNSLFVSCPHDTRRLYPNPAKMGSQQLEYYRFCGRVIALALMHDIQIGIGFDRLFFLQLAGGSIISLEDIRDADPYMYKSCKDILEMDTKFIDADGLGLTFVWETEELDESGCGRKIVELCPGGSTTVVYSLNREEYIKLVLQHCFVKSITEKVKLFTRGLDDVLTRRCRKKLLQNIELEDLDRILLERTNCEKDQDEHMNHNEDADASKTTPFQRMIETTLPISRLKYANLPLTCRDQHKPFRFV